MYRSLEEAEAQRRPRLQKPVNGRHESKLADPLTKPSTTDSEIQRSAVFVANICQLQ